jgi:hypothetical protein
MQLAFKVTRSLLLGAVFATGVSATVSLAAPAPVSNVGPAPTNAPVGTNSQAQGVNPSSLVNGGLSSQPSGGASTDPLTQARAVFRQMQQALAAGDYVRYGELMQQLSQILSSP